MKSRSTHVLPNKGKWVVKKGGDSKQPARTFATQKEALAAAHKMIQRLSAGQVVLHGLNGLFRIYESHGLSRRPRRRPWKSTLDPKEVNKAISASIREQLLSGN